MIRGSSLTLADLRLRLSELVVLTERSSASNPVNVAPTDVATKDRLNRAINDGAQEFASAVRILPNGRQAPVNWGWQWQRIEDFAVNGDGDAKYCIAGNPRRYFIPGAISFPRNDVRWTRDGSGGPVGETTFDQLLSSENVSPSETGCPRAWAAEFRPELGQIELRIFPEPDTAYTLSLKCKIGVPSLVNDSDRGIWPAVHDRTVLAYALLCFVRTDNAPDSPKVAFAQQMVGERLAASIAANGDMLTESAPSPTSIPTAFAESVTLSSGGTVIAQSTIYS